MRKRGIFEQLRRRQYLIAGALVVIAAVGTTVLYSNSREEERQQMEAELAEEMNENEPEVAAVEETEEAAAASAVISPKKNSETEEKETAETTEMLEIREKAEETQTETAEETQSEETAGLPEESGEEIAAEETAAQPEVLHFSPEDGMIWPMEGDIILNYSMDSSIYFPTLEHYRLNPAVIIAGEVNNKVYSVAKGQVTKIEEQNAETGCTVTVDLGDGYQAIYGQLKELTFDEGDYVEAGHIIGYISEPTKYYYVEGSNLFFELLKDGVPIDPVAYFE